MICNTFKQAYMIAICDKYFNDIVELSMNKDEEMYKMLRNYLIELSKGE